MIRFEDVSKVFPAPAGDGEVRALDHVSFDIRPGEFVAVVGPSGSGKSTLLHATGGLSAPSEGRVLLGDADVYGLGLDARTALRRREIGYVFQTFNLVPYLTCLENVMFPALLEGEGRARARAKAHGILERLGLSSRSRHRPAELSVGERQRVGIGRAIVNVPRVLLADEPTGNLDPDTADQVMALLDELHEDGLTVVMVTHDPRLSVRAGRVLELRGGSLVTQPGARLATAAAAS